MACQSLTKRIGIAAAFFGAGLLLAGCGMDLETDYHYRPLNASAVQRRAYYASPFSPEKSAAEQEQKQGGPKLGASQ